MLKKTITFQDFNGQERTEDFYFNFSRTEVTELELSVSGGLVEKINRIVAAQDGTEIMSLVKSFVLGAYGEKSPDGRRFMKSEEISKAFSETPAYDILFMELATDAEKMAAFINAVIPEAPKESTK